MRNWRIRSIFAFVAIAACLAVPAFAAVNGAALIVKDNGTGTASLPPDGGEYISPADIHAWLNSGVEITAELKARHGLFSNIITNPGGTLGGEVETFNSNLTFEIVGAGPLEGWSSTVTIPTKVETHTGPRKAGEEIQSFDTDMVSVQGAAKSGDFEYIEVVGGTANGFPSPGHTTLTRQKDGSFLVDSQFNVRYQIKYKGAKGSKLEGTEGVTEGVITMVAVPAGTNG